jgi:hypothetical protein
MALGAVLFAIHSPAVANQLNSWKVLPRTERLTELSFSNYESLPSHFHEGDSQTFTFKVHNLEHRTTDYRYTVTAIAAEKEQVLSGGALTLSHDSSQEVTQTIMIPALNRRVQIEVSLQYKGIGRSQDAPSMQRQAIRYWLDKIDVKEGKV